MMARSIAQESIDGIKLERHNLYEIVQGRVVKMKKFFEIYDIRYLSPIALAT